MQSRRNCNQLRRCLDWTGVDSNENSSGQLVISVRLTTNQSRKYTTAIGRDNLMYTLQMDRSNRNEINNLLYIVACHLPRGSKLRWRDDNKTLLAKGLQAPPGKNSVLGKHLSIYLVKHPNRTQHPNRTVFTSKVR